MIPANQYANLRREIEAALGENWTSSMKNITQTLINRMEGSVSGVMSTTIDQAIVSRSSYQLIKDLDAIKIKASEYIATEIDNNIFQRPRTGYNDTYQRMLNAYRDSEGQERMDLNIGVFQKYDTGDYSSDLEADKWPVPDVENLYVSRCATPTGTCWGYYVDANEHKHECELKHGVSGETNVDWWICQSSQGGRCTRLSEHWVPCRATNCNVLFPPPTSTLHTTLIAPGSFVTSLLTTYHDHETVCNEPVDRWYDPWATCGDKYFTCEGPCGHGSSSGSGSSSGTATPDPTPAPTPTYNACDVHLTSVEGDHSMHASCSSMDSNGNSCTGTNFYKCSHTHQYPYVDNTPDCNYCTDGCSDCQPSSNDDGDTQVTCPMCGGLWTRGEAAPICPFGTADQGYCYE